jgi:hypothetical protein
MFGRNTDDIARTLTQMQNQARIECRHNQTAMAKQMAAWMADDRRFDSIENKEAFALDAMDARSHGRELDLTQRVTLGDTAHARTAHIGGLASVLRAARSR